MLSCLRDAAIVDFRPSMPYKTFMRASCNTGDHFLNYLRQHKIATCSGSFPAVLKSYQSGRRPHRTPHLKGQKTSPTNSSHEAEAQAKAVEATSSSDTEDVEASSLCQEVTSPSSNADNATDTKAGQGTPKADTCEDITSPSSEILSLVPVHDNVGARIMPSKIRKYTMRRRKDGAPSVPIQGILTSKLVVVCRKAAAFKIGVSPQQVQRVLEGQADGRRKGMRLPCDSVTSGPMSVCLRFLWRNCRFDAEGLPDKFSIEGHDLTSMTIGAEGHPNRTRIPTRSALHLPGEACPNQDEVLEEEERAIAGLA